MIRAKTARDFRDWWNSLEAKIGDIIYKHMEIFNKEESFFKKRHL